MIEMDGETCLDTVHERWHITNKERFVISTLEGNHKCKFFKKLFYAKEEYIHDGIARDKIFEAGFIKSISTEWTYDNNNPIFRTKCLKCGWEYAVSPRKLMGGNLLPVSMK